MKVCILLVLGVIACNLGIINGLRMKRQLGDYCGLPIKLRNTMWNCMELNLPFKQRKLYSDIAQCFNEDNFLEVMNKLCDKTYEEIDAIVEPHENCLNELDKDELNDNDVDEEEVRNCVQNSL
ncbi:uncharacterized protein [Centruroides vittatus]|uniref:uncharacterized protein n=1 Tax=Centruroides vittatus TaxID=120091 RepID=UPI00350FE62C